MAAKATDEEDLTEEIEIGTGSTESESNSDEEDDDEDEDEEEDEDAEADIEQLDSAESSESESSESESEDGDDSFSGRSSVGMELWDGISGNEEETQEANEAKILLDFQKALDCVVSGKLIKAISLFQKLLKEPAVAAFHCDQFDWEADTDQRLSKMARVFVGVHKNLLSLDKDHAWDHYLQILSVAPRNSQLWSELGILCVEKGDLPLAKYSLQRAGSIQADEALVSVLYLNGEHTACLRLIKDLQDKGISTDTTVFLKERIRAENHHYRTVCDSLFDEDRYYCDPPSLNASTFKELDNRLTIAQRRLKNMDRSIEERAIQPIKLQIEADFSLNHVCILFCDLFDRIESYSSLARQEIIFDKWDDPYIYKDVRETRDFLLDVIDAVEDIIDKVVAEEKVRSRTAKHKSQNIEFLSEYAVRRSTRNIDADIPSEDESCSSSDPINSLAESLLIPKPIIQTLFCSEAKRPMKTPTPPLRTVIDESELMDRIRDELNGGTFTMFEIIVTVLLQLTECCPDEGQLPQHLTIVMIQLYRRLNRMQNDMHDVKYARLHLLMDDLGDNTGREYAIRWNFINGFSLPRDRNRFCWNHAKYSTDEEVKLTYLNEVFCEMDEESVVMAAYGYFTKEMVMKKIEVLEKARRINSIKELSACGLHDMVVHIITNDIDFSAIDHDELLNIMDIWLKSLELLKRHNEYCSVLTRYVNYLISTDIETEEFIESILDHLKYDWTLVEVIKLKPLAYVICELLVDVGSNWSLWKLLYQIVQRIEGEVTEVYIESLNGAKNADSMPSLAFDVLRKAHEALGNAGCCTKSDFLPFYLEELGRFYKNRDLFVLIRQDEYDWIWDNLQEEIAQCLFCVFGRYSKRRRVVEEHQNRRDVKISNDLAKDVVELALPIPLPQFDDKERLGHDVNELLLTKFSFLLKVDSDREKIVEEFDYWLKHTRRSSLDSEEACRWPRTRDTELQSTIWYVMCLNHYRQNGHEDTIKYAKLFLTGICGERNKKVAYSAWAMMAHAMSCASFADHFYSRQWEWRTMPHRFATMADESVGILHFNLANIDYQIATELERSARNAPADDAVHLDARHVPSLRAEAQHHFERSLALSNPDGTIEEYQWLSYLFLAKLQAKAEDFDVIKVVDYIYESACCCQLGNFFYYPQKIHIKKQGNLEPIEIHYQMYSTIWKYVSRMDNPPLNELIHLLAYARHFHESHKVVRISNNLFSCHPDIREVALRLSVEASELKPVDETEHLLREIVTKVELIEELTKLCYKGFEVVTDRFPHPKANYRMAEIDYYAEDRKLKAFEHLMRGFWRRRKKEDGFFDNVIEVISPDIDRIGSYAFHLERALLLTIHMLRENDDISNLLAIIGALVQEIAGESANAARVKHHRFVHLCIISLEVCLKHTGSPKQYHSELARLWPKLKKHERIISIKNIDLRLRNMFEKHIGDIDKFIESHASEEPKKKQYRKRRAYDYVPLPAKRLLPPPEPKSTSSNLSTVSQSNEAAIAQLAMAIGSSSSDLYYSMDPLQIFNSLLAKK